jgi:radical SAM-linked protein
MDLEFVQPLSGAELISRLQPQLPGGFQLLEATEVAVHGPSLSQELDAALWSLNLAPVEPGPSLEEPRWQAGVAALLAADQLIWCDTDKKGRARVRDCRPALRDLSIETIQAAGVSLRLEAAIDPAGRSIRPSQILHWLEEQLGQPLKLTRQRRTRILLKPVLDLV